MGDIQDRARVGGRECPHVPEQEGARGEVREVASLRWGLRFFGKFEFTESDHLIINVVLCTAS